MATGSWWRRTSTASLSVKVKLTFITRQPPNITISPTAENISSKTGWSCPQWSPPRTLKSVATLGCVPILTTSALVSSLCEWKRCRREEKTSVHWRSLFIQTLTGCLFFLPRYENGQIGDLWVDTQDNEINQEILQVIVSRHCWPSDPARPPSTSVLFWDFWRVFFVCMLCFVSWKTGNFYRFQGSLPRSDFSGLLLPCWVIFTHFSWGSFSFSSACSVFLLQQPLILHIFKQILVINKK